MTYSNILEIQRKKIKVEDDQEEACTHDFWNEAPEDVLTEIFIRHPDCRSALRTTTVCRRWRSLISRNPHFVERFKSHHRRHHHRYPPESLPWALLNPEQCSEANTCHVCSDEWVFLHGKLPPNCFDILPNCPFVKIKTSCNDLFLVFSYKNDNHYVCNPITKQFFQVPPGPRLEDAINVRGLRSGVLRHAVVGPTADIIIGFKVVQVCLFQRYRSLSLEHDNLIVVVAVFCSVSRKWETRSFPCPGVGYHYTNEFVSVDGVLYWLGRRDDYSRQILVYLDLEKDKCGTIGIPSFGGPYCKDIIGAIPVSGGSHELRLMQVDGYMNKNVYLKVWRLNNNSNWISVHDKRVLARPEYSCLLRGAFVHPTSGDLVLCVWGKNVFEYNLVHSTYKKFAELSKIDSSSSLKRPFFMVNASGSPTGLEN